MKTLASYSKPEEAHLVRAHLEGSGIAAFVRDDLTVSADWGLSNAVGGVKVEVADEDYDQARSTLAAFTPQEEKEPTKLPKHKFRRYVKLSILLSVVIYGFIAWRASNPTAEGYILISIPSFFIAVCIAGIAAVFDL